MHVSETPDSEDELIEIVDSKAGVSCITISDSDKIISPSSPKSARQTKLRLKLHMQRVSTKTAKQFSFIKFIQD